MSKEINKKRNTPNKKRSQSCYNNKVKKIEDWYNHILKNRNDKDGLGKDKQPLKPLDYFIDKIKKPVGE
jgi:hypothetical protein